LHLIKISKWFLVLKVKRLLICLNITLNKDVNRLKTKNNKFEACTDIIEVLFFKFNLSNSIKIKIDLKIRKMFLLEKLLM